MFACAMITFESKEHVFLWSLGKHYNNSFGVQFQVEYMLVYYKLAPAFLCQVPEIISQKPFTNVLILCSFYVLNITFYILLFLECTTLVKVWFIVIFEEPKRFFFKKHFCVGFSDFYDFNVIRIYYIFVCFCIQSRKQKQALKK